METLEQKIEMAERLAVVTQNVGFSLWQLQKLESVSAQYFVLLAQATKGMGLEAGKALEVKAKKRTFGATFQQMKKAGLLPDDLPARFERILSERNWLVHSSRADSRGAIHNTSAKENLVNRLEKIAEEALFLIKAIGNLTETYVMKHGVTKEYIDKKAQELLREWQESDSIY